MNNQFISGEKLLATGQDENEKEINAVVSFSKHLPDEEQEYLDIGHGRTVLMDCIILVNGVASTASVHSLSYLH
jgi:hypothetical protein